MDIMKLVTPQEADGDTTRYSVQPGDLYPAMQAYIQDVLEGEQDVMEFEVQSRDAARLLGVDAFDLVTEGKEDVAQEDVSLRADALEIARRWFTAKLHRASGAGRTMELHIAMDEKYRL